ncbi:MAG: hypothetical protein R8K50_03955 [Mariprofundus sp.]
MSNMQSHHQGASCERGFVLVTSLIMLSLLTLLSMAMYFSGRIATQSSRSVQTTTEAYYFAETAVNYMTWALINDAEFDSHVNKGTYIHRAFPEPAIPTNAVTVGDYNELRGNLFNPGPTLINSDAGYGIIGQVKYFDNSPMDARAICFEDATVFGNCTDVTISPGERKQPTLYHISTKLPRYIKLDIKEDGTITSSIPQLPHQNPPVVGQDIPFNGAVVWLTAGDVDPALTRDIEIYPVNDKENKLLRGTACTAGQMINPKLVTPVTTVCPCPAVVTGQACDAHAKGNAYANTGMGAWVNQYDIVIYAIGYVNGRPSHMLRSVVQ